MNNTKKIMKAVVAGFTCVTLCGTALAAPCGGNCGRRAPAHHGGHCAPAPRHCEPPPPPPPPPAPHPGCHHGGNGWVTLGAAVIGGVVGGLVSAGR